MTKFWLDKIIRQSKIPYPVFFILISILFYLIGIPLMITWGNISTFLSEPKWFFMVIYGIASGIFVFFVYRRFQDSLNDIKHMICLECEFEKFRDKLLSYLTLKFYWISVFLLPILNMLRFLDPTGQLTWWWFYNQPFLVTVYYFIGSAPSWVFGGIFVYMIPFGLTLAYRDLCLKTSFKKEILSVEWMEPFKRFKSLITLSMLFAVIISLLGFLIWAPTLGETSAIYITRTRYIPYAMIAIILIPTILFPHFYFHKLFSKIKEKRLKDLRREIVKIRNLKKKDKLNEILYFLRKLNLLFDKGEAEKLKTWLIDVKVLGEILIVALMHVILIEVLTSFIH